MKGPSQSETSGGASSGLARDPIVLGGVVVWFLAIIPSLLPLLSADATYTWADQFSDVPSLILIVGALALGVVRAEDPTTRLFWWLIQIAILCWLGVRVLFVVVPFEQWGTGMDLASDVLYLCGYLLLAMGLERQIRLQRSGGDTKAEYFEAAGTLVFGFGLLAYFVVAPSVFNPDVYETWVTSLLLYAVIDLYLVVRSARWLQRNPPGAPWHGPAFWMLVTSAFWLVSDLAEGFMYMEVLPWVDPGTPWDLLWHAPALTLLLVVRSGPPPEAQAEFWG